MGGGIEHLSHKQRIFYHLIYYLGIIAIKSFTH